MKKGIYLLAIIFAMTVLLAGCGSSSSTPAPTITSLAPSSGPPGTTVTITGTNFSTTPASNIVMFNGTAAVVTSSTATQIVTTVPAGATTGSVTVMVGSNTATSPASFTVTPGAAITAVAPLFGLPGTTVTITGSEFSTTPTDNIVKFNGTDAVVTSSTATQIVTTVPAGATSGSITVEVMGNTGTSPASFTVAALVGGAVQGNPLTLSTAVTTLAGTQGSAGSADGTGTAATFSSPSSITTDGTNLYVADFANNLIRKIDSSGVVTTLAGSGLPAETDDTGTAAAFNGPAGITTDGTNLYVTDYSGHTIRQVVIASGVVTTLAGSGTAGAADGDGTAATFDGPIGITTDGTNLYVTDRTRHTIRQIGLASPNTVSTLAGTAGTSGSADGTGTAATFNQPSGITTDGTNLYVADRLNYEIRQVVISSGVVTTLAGTGSLGYSDGTGTLASFNQPNGITTDGTNLYVADRFGYTIRQIVLSSGVVTTLAGSAGASGFADGTGVAATFNEPYGITTDGTNLYVTDYANQTIRMIE